ncbi:hypothetical protein OBBRIDRAFT_714168, partial [Obba rivulosa]
LFAYTAGRWLCNEEKQLSLRRTPFNVDALEDIVCRSVAAQRCMGWEKIGEGSFNKVFLLRFDNGREVVVRIPCPFLGNVERTTASEVATMEYVRERWASNQGMPKPPKVVITWNSTYNNPAGTPYIILEYAQGVPLLSRWYQIEGKVAGAALTSLVMLETILLHQPFSQYGSLYFADDVHGELRDRPLYPSVVPYSSSAPVQSTALKYRIGPTVNREWYRGPYSTVDADRGPWPDMQTVIQSAANFQLQAIARGIDFDSPHIKSKPSDILELRRLLEMCIKVASLIVPDNPAITMPVLNHPDLTLSNLIVPAEGDASVVNAIDWQCATVSPLCTQGGLPSFVTYSQARIPIPTDGSMPPWPDNFDSMPPEEQDLIRVHHRLACRHRIYSLIMHETSEDRTEAWALPHYEALANLAPYATRCIADGPLGLRALLVELQDKWDAIAECASAAASCACPVDFTPDELAAHAMEARAQAEYEENVNRLCSEI